MHGVTTHIKSHVHSLTAATRPIFWGFFRVAFLSRFIVDFQPCNFHLRAQTSEATIYNYRNTKLPGIREQNQEKDHRNPFSTNKSAGFYSDQPFFAPLYDDKLLQKNWVWLSVIFTGKLSPFNLCRAGKLGFDLMDFIDIDSFCSFFNRFEKKGDAHLSARRRQRGFQRVE